jgi:hypothetical protein
MVEFQIDALSGRQQQPPSELSVIRLELQVIGGFSILYIIHELGDNELGMMVTTNVAQ